MAYMNKVGGIREYIISAVLVGLFVIAIFNFANLSSLDNNARNIMNDPRLNSSLSSMNNALNTFNTNTNTQLNATNQEKPSTSFGSLILFSILDTGRVFIGSVTSVFSVITNLMSNVLNIPPVVIYVLTGAVLVSLIFFAWRMYRLGT